MKNSAEYSPFWAAKLAFCNTESKNGSVLVGMSVFHEHRRLGAMMRVVTGLLLLLTMCGTAHAAGSYRGLVIPNLGQVHNGAGVRYYMDSPWGRMYITDQGLVLQIASSKQDLAFDSVVPPLQHLRARPSRPSPYQVTNIHLDLPGASWHNIIAEDPQFTKLNFFYGNDPACWVSDVPTYGRLRIHDIFSGTDLIIVPASTNFWHAEGATSDLQETLSATLEQHINALGLCPAETNSQGPGAAEPPIRPLIRMAPNAALANAKSQPDNLQWSTYLGGYYPDYIYAVGVDSQDNVIIAGATQSYDFPVLNGYDTATDPYGFYDMFVVKLSSDGSRMLWGTFLGGNNDDLAYAMAQDASGVIVIVGGTMSADAPVSPGAFDITFNGGELFGGVTKIGDIYVAKLSPAGDQLLFGTYIGGWRGDEAYACALDAAGNVIVEGLTLSDDMPVQNGFGNQLNGEIDIYLAQLSADGKQLFWSSYLGGSSTEVAYSLALNAYENIIIAGNTSSADIPTPGGFESTMDRNGSMYIAEISVLENRVVWGTYLGGDKEERATAMSLDPSGNVVVLGWTYSDDIPTPGGYDTIYNESDHMYCAKISSDGTSLLWGTYVTGAAGSQSVVVDPQGEVLIVGRTSDVTAELYIAALSSSGNCLEGDALLGGSDFEWNAVIVLDSLGNPIIAGSSSSKDFPTTLGAFDTTYNGPSSMRFSDGFIAKFSGAPRPAEQDLYVAAAAHTPGANGTQWRTDGMVLNPGAEQACFDLHFIEPGDSAGTDHLCETRCLDGGTAWWYQDILFSACGIDAASAGSLHVEATRPLLLTTRTYNQQAQGGTYGQFIEGVEDTKATNGIGSYYYVLGLKQNADFRTNMGFAEISGQATTVEIHFYDSSNSQIQVSTLMLPPLGWYQANLADLGITSLEPGRAMVKVLSGGKILGFASVIDNRTGDAIFIPVASYADSYVTNGHLMVPIVAHAEGAYGTHWQTDLFFKVSSESNLEIVFTLATTSETFQASVNMPENGYIEVEDVIAQWFPEAGNASGVLSAYMPDLDMAAVTRTYNSTSSGTYGQFVPAVDQNRLLSPGQQGYLLQLQCTPEFRTNVGFSEYSGLDTSVQVSLFASNGTELGSHAYALGAGKNLQIGDIFSSLGASCDVEAAYAVVIGLSGGTVFPYASVVDNRTGDAVFIPVQNNLFGGCHD